MNDEVKWARVSDDYTKRAAGQETSPAIPGATAQERYQHEDTGVRRASFKVDRIKPRSIERSRHSFRAHLTELIWNAAALEGTLSPCPKSALSLLESASAAGSSPTSCRSSLPGRRTASSTNWSATGSFLRPRPCPMNSTTWRPGTRRSNLATSEQKEQSLVAGWRTSSMAVPCRESTMGPAALRKRFADGVQHLA